MSAAAEILNFSSALLKTNKNCSFLALHFFNEHYVLEKKDKRGNNCAIEYRLNVKKQQGSVAFYVFWVL